MKENCPLCGEELWGATDDEAMKSLDKNFLGLQTEMRFSTKNGDICTGCVYEIGREFVKREEAIRNYRRASYYESLPWYRFYKRFLPFPEDSKEVGRFWKLVGVVFFSFVIGRSSIEWSWVNEICNFLSAILHRRGG